MPGPVLGMFFYLYLIVDIFSRKIVEGEQRLAVLGQAGHRFLILGTVFLGRGHDWNGNPS